MLLVLGSLFHLCGKHFARLLLFDLEDFSEGSGAEFLLDFESAIQNFLTFFQVRHLLII